MVQLSVCMTNYNTADVIRRSLDSILALLADLDFEIVVVDSASTDGSYKILAEYARSYPNFRLMRLKCLRGIGWQTAFLHSTGELVVLAACDTVYNRYWRRLIDLFLENRYQFGLSAIYTEIFPRHLLKQVGGWRNLQYWEDMDLRARLAAIGAFRNYPVVCGQNLKGTPATNRVERAWRLYRRIHDKMLVASWLPTGIYLRGYFWQIAKQRGLGKYIRLAYYMPIVAIAAGVSTARRRRFRSRGADARILSSPRWLVDLKIAPPEDLEPPNLSYSTREGCEAALLQGDFRFLPGFYD